MLHLLDSNQHNSKVHRLGNVQKGRVRFQPKDDIGARIYRIDFSLESRVQQCLQEYQARLETARCAHYRNRFWKKNRLHALIRLLHGHPLHNEWVYERKGISGFSQAKKYYHRS